MLGGGTLLVDAALLLARGRTIQNETALGQVIYRPASEKTPIPIPIPLPYSTPAWHQPVAPDVGPVHVPSQALLRLATGGKEGSGSAHMHGAGIAAGEPVPAVRRIEIQDLRQLAPPRVPAPTSGEGLHRS